MNKKAATRRCVGCLQMLDKRDMIRVIKNADGEISLDRTGKQNGRGAYICPNAQCLAKAEKNHGIERSFKAQIPVEVYEQLKQELEGGNE